MCCVEAYTVFMQSQNKEIHVQNVKGSWYHSNWHVEEYARDIDLPIKDVQTESKDVFLVKYTP